MYGLLFHNLQAFLVEKFGEEVFGDIRKHAGLQEHVFCVHKQYPDKLLSKILVSAAEITGWHKADILRGMGREFPKLLGEYGYEKIMKTVGRNLKEFLNGLDHMHDCLRYSYPGMRTPSFYCDEETESGLRLHYRSKRKGYVSYVRGQIESIAMDLFHIKVEVEIESVEEFEHGTHTILKILFKNKVAKKKASTGISDLCPMISTEVILQMFPFHILFRNDFIIFGVGQSLHKILPDLSGRVLSEYFRLTRPAIELTWENVVEHPNCVFELRTRDGKTKQNKANYERTNNDTDLPSVHLKGQMMHVEHWDAFIYLASPVLEDLDEMYEIGLYLNDLSIHDASRDLVSVGNQKSAELTLALDQELHKSAMLEDSMRKLDEEMQKTDKLLYSMIPKTVANRLRKGDLAVNTCEHFENVTVLFSDVVGFTKICSKITPMGVMEMLNDLYTSFDTLSEEKKVYKVETIGDAYMVVSGVPDRINIHAENVADMAFAMLKAVAEKKDPSNAHDHIRIRIGIHSGSVVAGVVGIKMPRYCLFGDTVNIASRMETSSVAMAIQVSESTKILLKSDEYIMRTRGSIQLKGKGMMRSYWLVGKGKSTGAISVLSLKSIKDSCVPEFVTFADENLIENESPDLPEPCNNQESDANELVNKNTVQDLLTKPARHSNAASISVTTSPDTNSEGFSCKYLHTGSERTVYPQERRDSKRKRSMPDNKHLKSGICVLL